MVIRRLELHEPKKIIGIKIRGEITDSKYSKEDQWFTFYIQPKSRDLRKELKELRPRVQKIKNKKDNYFRPTFTFKGDMVQLIYLNWESAKGLYKNPDNNLPYEVLNINGNSIYRQSRIERKEDIFNKLEKAAMEEGLRSAN